MSRRTRQRTRVSGDEHICAANPSNAGRCYGLADMIAWRIHTPCEVFAWLGLEWKSTAFGQPIRFRKYLTCAAPSGADLPGHLPADFSVWSVTADLESFRLRSPMPLRLDVVLYMPLDLALCIRSSCGVRGWPRGLFDISNRAG